VLYATAELVTEENGRAPKQHIDEEIILIRGVLGSTLADDSLMISTEGKKKCLEMAKSLAQCYGSVVCTLVH